MADDTFIKSLYMEVAGEAIHAIDPELHTMRPEAFKAYVETKFSLPQKALLLGALREGHEFHVHGIFRQHLQDWLAWKELVLKTDLLTLDRWGRKRFNNQRPQMALCQSRDGSISLRLFVFPSREYVQQFAGLTAQILAFMGHHMMTPAVTAWLYPACFNSLPAWSGLLDGLVSSIEGAEFAVIGAVDHVIVGLQECGFVPASETQHFGWQATYGLDIYQHAQQGTATRIALLGVKESFWGSAAGLISAALAEAGVSQLFYVSKVGTFTHPLALHRLVCPTAYHLCDNGIHPYTPESSLRDNLTRDVVTGNHISVPTVLGETFAQLQTYKHLRPATIDNEAGYIAQSLADWTKRSGRGVQYTSLHFTTDYLASRSEEPYALFNLSHVHDRTVTTRRHETFVQAGRLIGQHCSNSRTVVSVQMEGAQKAYLLSNSETFASQELPGHIRLTEVHNDLVDEWLITTTIEQRLVEIDCSSLSSWEELLTAFSHKIENNLSVSTFDAVGIASICEEVELILLLRLPEELFNHPGLSDDHFSGNMPTLLASFLQLRSKATVMIVSKSSVLELRKILGIS